MTEILLLISLACNILIIQIWISQLEKYKKELSEVRKELEGNKGVRNKRIP